MPILVADRKNYDTVEDERQSEVHIKNLASRMIGTTM